MSTKFDLNLCTARQLSSIPGIDDPLADSIIAMRRVRKKYQHMDQLWKVSGMTRAKFRILLNHAKVVGQSAPPVGSTPYYVPSQQFVAIPSSRPPFVWKTPRVKPLAEDFIGVLGKGTGTALKRPTTAGVGRNVPRSSAGNVECPVKERAKTAIGTASKSVGTPTARKPAKSVENKTSVSSVEEMPLGLPQMHTQNVAKQKELNAQKGRGKNTQAEKLNISKSGNRLTLTYRFDENDRVNISDTVVLRAKSSNQEGKQAKQPRSPKAAWDQTTQYYIQQGKETTNLAASFAQPVPVELSCHNLAMHEASLSEEEETPRLRRRNIEKWVEHQSKKISGQPFRTAGPGSSGPGKKKCQPKRGANRGHPEYPVQIGGPPVPPTFVMENQLGEVPEPIEDTGAGYGYHLRIRREQKIQKCEEFDQNNDEESVPTSSKCDQTATGGREKGAVRIDHGNDRRHRHRSNCKHEGTTPRRTGGRIDDGRKRHMDAGNEHSSPKRMRHKSNQANLVQTSRYSPPATRSRTPNHAKGKRPLRGKVPKKSSGTIASPKTEQGPRHSEKSPKTTTSPRIRSPKSGIRSPRGSPRKRGCAVHGVRKSPRLSRRSMSLSPPKSEDAASGKNGGWMCYVM